jgi:predicted nucleic acid-binding protein
MFLLDTNVISELRKLHRADRHVREWAEQTDLNDHFLSVVSILEIEHGALLLKRRDPAQGAVLMEWLEDYVLRRFEGRILPVDISIARRCAELHVPDPRADRDAFIAATALTYGFAVVTRNVRDFEPMGVVILNPWAAPN